MRVYFSKVTFLSTNEVQKSKNLAHVWHQKYKILVHFLTAPTWGGVMVDLYEPLESLYQILRFQNSKVGFSNSKIGLSIQKCVIRHGNLAEDIICDLIKNRLVNRHKYSLVLFIDVSGLFHNMWWISSMSNLKRIFCQRMYVLCYFWCSSWMREKAIVRGAPQD